MKKALIIFCVVAALVLAACIGVFVYLSLAAGSRDAATEPTTEATTQATTEATTQATTIPQTTAPAQITAPQELEQLLARQETDIRALADLGCTQLVCVDTSGSTARISFYTLIAQQWRLQEEKNCSGYLGRNGISADKREGDGMTPKGLYHIGHAFYMGQTPPETGLDIFPITQDTYWVDDPNSKYYNQRVEGTADKDWNSAEHMIKYGSYYEYGFVIDYNTQCVPYAGSAIFFHVSDISTSGCVATDRASVLAYLAALDKACNPYILIV